MSPRDMKNTGGQLAASCVIVLLSDPSTIESNPKLPGPSRNNHPGTTVYNERRI